jgi:hypothetical protein
MFGVFQQPLSVLVAGLSSNSESLDISFLALSPCKFRAGQLTFAGEIDC